MKKIVLILSLFLTMTINLLSQGWIQQNSGTTQHLRDVYFINRDTGYAVGGLNTGVVLKTTNGGINWNQINIGSNIISYSVFFLNEFTGFITPPSITKTTNSGTNWIMTGASGCLDIFFLNNNEGYACGYSGLMLKTTNEGNNWITLSSPVNSEIGSIYFLNSLTGFATTYFTSKPSIFYQILRTTNGGYLWTIHQQGSSSSTTRKTITFSDSVTGYFTDANKIYRSPNGGNNWFLIYTVTPYNSLYDVNFPSPRCGYVVGNNGVIYKTSDYGSSWNALMSGVSNILYSVFFADTLVGYAVGHSGIILKTTNGGVTFIHPISTEIPNQFSLSQNYPNPFNPNSKIKMQIAKLSGVKLVVFDVVGREIVTLVNEELKPGTYEVDFDGANYSSGVYYYKLTAGDFTETKKMVLMK